MAKYRVCVNGSRTVIEMYQLFGYLEDELIPDRLGKKIIINQGEAPGPDRIAKKWAILKSVEQKPFPADWDNLGKPAGYIRNVQMIDDSDMLISFWDGNSKGTKHTIDYALKKRKRVIIYLLPQGKRIEVSPNGHFFTEHVKLRNNNRPWRVARKDLLH